VLYMGFAYLKKIVAILSHTPLMRA
jgi:hypothetical protein